MTYLLIRTISVLVTSYITKVGVPIALTWQTGWTAFVFAVVLAIINHTIKPAIAGITLPITILTLGLFSVVVNGAMVLLAAFFVPGFSMPSFFMAMVFAFVLTLVNFVLHAFE
jgi:putative membrane protein